MKVDVQSFDTFNRLAHEGAEQAAASMAQLTGIEASVEVTRISMIDRADIGQELGDSEFVGVEFGFEGAMSGDTVLVFESGTETEIVEAMLPDGTTDEGLARSSLEEVANIMMSGFIDGWADHLEASIEHTPPTYLERSGTDMFPDDPETAARDQIFIFRSNIRWEGGNVDFYIYMLPEYEPLARLMADHADTTADAIPIDKLAAFNEMTRAGTQTAAENVEMMTGLEIDAEVTQIAFSPIEDAPKQLGTEPMVGTVVEFTGSPSGYLVVLFDEPSAKNVSEALMTVSVEGDELTEQHKTAIEELGNILTSGFVDGWANVLQQSIDHSPPRLVHDMGRAIIDPLAAQLGQHQRHAFIIDSRMKTDDLAFECEIHALPNEQELRTALEDLVVERTTETGADVERIF